MFLYSGRSTNTGNLAAILARLVGKLGEDSIRRCQNQAINFSISNDASTVYKGILVVWCDDLVQQQSFNGIILNLRGNGFTYEAPDGTTVQTSSCGLEKGRYTNDGYVGGSTASDKTVMCRCWVYAQGGDGTGAGVVMENGSKATYPTNRTWSFLNDAFETDSPPPTKFELQSWRELYE
jgi:hypothetical protein